MMGMVAAGSIAVIVLVLSGFHLLRLAGLPVESGQVAFMSDKRAQWDIYVLDVARGIVQPITNDLAAQRYPAWSPDGESIAYHANIGLDYDLYIMDADGRNARVMGLDSDNAYHDQAMLKWHPSGEAVVYHAGIQNSSNFQLYLGDVASGDFYRVIEGLGDSIHADWSPDGTRLAFSARRVVEPYDVHMTIYVLEMDGQLPHSASAATALTPEGYRAYFPAWSPDGEQIAYVVSAAGIQEEDIYVMNADGSNPRNLTPGTQAANTHPVWLPDGRILFASDRAGTFDLYMMDADGGNVRRLTHERMNAQAPDWRP